MRRTLHARWKERDVADSRLFMMGSILIWLSAVQATLSVVILTSLIKTGRKIMATQKELIEKSKAQLVVITQIGIETDKLIQTVTDLQTVIDNLPDASPELVAAVEAVSEQLKIVDDKVPDAPVV